MVPQYSPDNQVYGETALNLAVIGGAVFLLLASIWTAAAPLPNPAMQAFAQPAVEQVVVVAHPSHVS